MQKPTLEPQSRIPELIDVGCKESIRENADRPAGAAISGEDGAEACCSRDRRALRPVDAGHDPAGAVRVPDRAGFRTGAGSLTGLRKESTGLAETLDYLIAKRLRRQGVVTVVPGIPRKQTRWIDGYGNLEATPPFTDREGRRFPYGRVITGKQRELTMHPGVMKFLEAQAVQWPPIVSRSTRWSPAFASN